MRGTWSAGAGQRNVPTEKRAKLPTQPVRPPLRARGPGPALVLSTSNSLNPGEPSTVRQEKPKKWRQSLWDAGGGTAGSTAPAGAAALVCVGFGGKRGWLHVCTNSPWIGKGLTPRARPCHRVTLGCCQLEGRGSPLLVVRGSEGQPLASAPIGHHVSRPYVKGGAIWGAGGAVAGCRSTRLATGLAGDRRQAASAIQGLGAAGIAGGAPGGCGQVVLLLLVICILSSSLLAAVILEPTVAQDSDDAEKDDRS